MLRQILQLFIVDVGAVHGEHVAVPEDAKPGDRALFKGVAPSEPSELKVTDFEKIKLSAKGGAVFCTVGEGAAAVALEVNGKPVTCDITDGNGVH